MPDLLPNLVRLLVAGVIVAVSAVIAGLQLRTTTPGSPAPKGTETAPLT